jgi:hypothetical protein
VIADTNAHRILRVSATGATRVIAGSRTFVAASPRRRAVQAPTAVLTRTSWGVRKGCRLRPRYRATVSAPGYLKRWDGKALWNGGVRPFLRRFKTRAVDFGYGRHRVYFWTTKTSFSEATLVVRRPACR